jgi:hypothetical protein
VPYRYWCFLWPLHTVKICLFCTALINDLSICCVDYLLSFISPGTTSRLGEGICGSAVPPGTYTASGIGTFYTLCPSGYYSGYGQTACLPCAVGFFCSASAQTPCPRGTYSAALATACTPCPAGFSCLSCADSAQNVIKPSGSTTRGDCGFGGQGNVLGGTTSNLLAVNLNGLACQGAISCTSTRITFSDPRQYVLTLTMNTGTYTNYYLSGIGGPDYCPYFFGANITLLPLIFSGTSTFQLSVSDLYACSGVAPVACSSGTFLHLSVFSTVFFVLFELQLN